ncbi:MAG TPA: hypothetical protein DCP69_04885 [Candidatus Omnitrophica bacterium]|nr:hypothetical protein [Candidatus Omnitrophota bacterium]
MIVHVTAPFRWNRAVFNPGEVVDLPAAFALQLVEAGQARVYAEPVTAAVDGPPAHKLMTPKRKKFFTSHTSRQETR